MLQHFQVFTRSCAAIEENGQGEGAEKHNPEKNQHRIRVERRIYLADVRKQQGSSEEDGGLCDQAAAEDVFGGG
jgi:hypothetical protein